MSKSRQDEAKMAGKFYEELEVGQTITHSLGRTLTEMDNVLFSALTMNTQPLHLNEDYAQRESDFGRRIVNGIFTLGLAVGITVADLTGVATQDIEIARAVYEETVHAH